ncbi:MAG TPA: MBL fold metallo-hydrolase [Polyangiaceae bacterium]|nr:MBL fold metallo-hydrolase [Polyangiaceae bacterium]
MKSTQVLTRPALAHWALLRARSDGGTVGELAPAAGAALAAWIRVFTPGLVIECLLPMRVNFYGVRGSVPAPGPQTARYGGNTSCVEVRLADGSIIALDAGTGLRELGNTLVREGRESQVHLLLSHTHWDHVMGLPFFAPLWNKANRLIVYPLANDAQERFQRNIFDDIHFPVSVHDIPAKVELAKPDGPEWRIGSARVRPVQLNHPGGAQGFRIDDDDGSSVAYLTDNELNAATALITTDALARFAEGVDLLIHDSQYLVSDMPHKLGWGHSLVDDVLALGALAEPARLALFHHDPDRTDDALDALGHRCRSWLQDRSRGIELVMASEGLCLELSRSAR